MNTKQCRKCKEVKDVSEFYKHSTTKDRLSNFCKPCASKSSIESQRKLYEKRINGELAYLTKDVKVCPNCGVEKESSAFYKDLYSYDGLKAYCKECDKNSRNARYAKKKLQYIQPTEKPRYGLIDLNRVTLVDEFKRAKIIQEQLYDTDTSLLEITKKHRSVIVLRNQLELPKFTLVKKDVDTVNK